MASFAGSVWSDGALALSREGLAAMLARLPATLAAPDPVYHVSVRPGLAHYPTPGVAMGFRRSVRGNPTGATPDAAANTGTGVPIQPVAIHDGALVGMFTGSLDNRVELRRRLDGRSVQYRTGGDAEMLLHLFRDEGPHCFSLLCGHFSAAIWDADHQRLVLARDRYGGHPLFYRAEAQRITFATSLAALAAAGGLPALDVAACDEYLAYGYVPAPHTLIEGVQKLPPGYLAEYRHDRLEFTRYFDPVESLQGKVDASAPHQALRNAVHRQAGDGPVAVWLRGGLPQALLAAIANDVSPGQVRGIAMGAPQDAAEAVSQQLGIPCDRFSIPAPTWENLAGLALEHDDPLADAQSWAWRSLAAQLPADCRILDAVGAAEIGGAHQRYAQCRAWSDRLPRWLYRMLSPREARRQDEWQLRHKTLPPHQQRKYFESISLCREAQRAALYQAEHLFRLPDADPFDLLRFDFARLPGYNAAESFRMVDLLTDIPYRQVAGLSASFVDGREFRLPFLEPTVAMALWKSTGRGRQAGHGSRSLRQALRPFIPAAMRSSGAWKAAAAYESRIDGGAWLRQELREAAGGSLTSPSAHIAQFASPEAVAALWREHQGGRDHGPLLWGLLMLELWLRKFDFQPLPKVAVELPVPEAGAETEPASQSAGIEQSGAA